MRPLELLLSRRDCFLSMLLTFFTVALVLLYGITASLAFTDFFPLLLGGLDYNSTFSSFLLSCGIF